MARKKKLNLPSAGAAFACPLADGRFSVCRVLVDTSSARSRLGTGNSILVAGSSWIGDQVPSPEDPALRPILRLNHHSWKNQSNALWISDEPPADFLRIGVIQPTKKEQAISCQSFGGWKSLMLQPLAQWRWDHERQAVQAEDAVKRQQELDNRSAGQRERQRYLANTTLAALSERRFFSRWTDYPPRKAITASRKIMVRTVEQLLELGPAAGEEHRMAVLQSCIESFNDLDSELQFIETTVREDICEEFEAIVHACGLGAYQDLADEWRDW